MYLIKLVFQAVVTAASIGSKYLYLYNTCPATYSLTTANRGHDDNDITINLNCHLGTYYISSISLIRAHFFIVTFFKQKRELPGIPITRIVWRNVHSSRQFWNSILCAFITFA